MRKQSCLAGGLEMFWRSLKTDAANWALRGFFLLRLVLLLIYIQGTGRFLCVGGTGLV